MLNNPINASDPSGHKCVGEPDECLDNDGNPINGAGGFGGENKKDENKHKPLKHMKPGDIITVETMLDGEILTHNYMLGLMDDHETLGFWDLDTRSYVPYDIVATTVDLSDSWTVFKRVNPKSFDEYEVMSSSGTPSTLGSFDYYWTGGVDNNPAYVEIATKVDWENMPSEFAWSVLGPYLVTSFWADAKPSVTPLNNAGYWPLTNYLHGLTYFAKDGAALERYPLIHLQPSLTEKIFNPLQ